MEHTLMELPFDKKSLEPNISSETLTYHHERHHQGYVNKLNELIKNTPYERMTLVEIVIKSSGSIFNNAAQVFNHDFYFKSMSHKPSNPSNDLNELVKREFGTMENLKKSFIEAGLGLFGSGWVWLTVSENGTLQIETYSNADNPLSHENFPLMTCDLWEHAYYIDYRNSRAGYLENWWNLINWDFVNENLAEYQQCAPECLEDYNVVEHV